MKEDFLHYIWQYKKFDFANLTTTAGEALTIVHSGHYLGQSGPDFFNAQLVINQQKWAGNVEIHVKSSDWYLHHHQNDNRYDTIILHVVWEHDVPVFRSDNTEIPVLELKNHVASEIVQNYQNLMQPKSWINCERHIAQVDSFVFTNWLARLFLERLETKSVPVLQLLAQSGNDWEAVLFYGLAKNFGLNTNGEAFLKIAQSIPFAVIRKASFEVENTEALLLGQAGLLSPQAEDTAAQDLWRRFDYWRQKYRLQSVVTQPVQFFKHRPDNFPTIRLAQLAMLYHCQQHLFSKLMATKTKEDLYRVFDVGVSDYWQTHYLIDKASAIKPKKLSRAFIDLLMVNTVIPMQLAYGKHLGKEVSEAVMTLAETISPEKNTIIEKFFNFGVKATNAFETQALLQLKNKYCNHGQCLQCVVGTQLLKQTHVTHH
ncbi:DUF2851 family protein [Flavobacterium sp.]|uniref:DUF2851 family protein n=1 Tax=Flavobacterium sp. TaxID=239 RepID=UPI002FDD0847